MKKYMMWEMDAKTVCKIIDLALKHGKKAGDSMEDELKEIIRTKQGNIKFRGLINEKGELKLTKPLKGKKILIIKNKEKQ